MPAKTLSNAVGLCPLRQPGCHTSMSSNVAHDHSTTRRPISKEVGQFGSWQTSCLLLSLSSQASRQGQLEQWAGECDDGGSARQPPLCACLHRQSHRRPASGRWCETAAVQLTLGSCRLQQAPWGHLWPLLACRPHTPQGEPAPTGTL